MNRTTTRPFGVWGRADAPHAAQQRTPGHRGACWTPGKPPRPAPQGPYRRSDRLARLEAVMLLAREPLTSRRIAQLANLADGTESRTLIRQLNAYYDETATAFTLAKVAGGYLATTRAKFAPWLRRLSGSAEPVRLSTPALETLAVVAYRQPVLRADVEAIRGVGCGEILRQLMEREMVRIAGRADELGRPFLYGTTKRFLRVFGLHGLDALPPVEGPGTLAAEPVEPLEDNDQTMRPDQPAAESTPEPPPSGKEPTVTTSVGQIASEPSDADVNTAPPVDEQFPSVFDEKLDDDEEDDEDPYEDEEDDEDEYEDEDDEDEHEEDEDEEDDLLDDDLEDGEWEEVDDDEEEDEDYEYEDSDDDDDDEWEYEYEDEEEK